VPDLVENYNFLITGVGGQGTVLASDILAAVGLAAGYDVKKSDILGLAVRGGAVVGHVRWGEHVYSPIVPEGWADYLIALETLEGLRWLNQMRPEGTVLLNEQEIHPVTVSSGAASYPDAETMEEALRAAAARVYRVPGLSIAQEEGNAKVVNVVLLGALSALLPVQESVWEQVLQERVPSRFLETNQRAFATGRRWLQQERS